MVHDKTIVLTPTVMVVWVSEGVGPLDGRAGPGRVTTSLRAPTFSLSTAAVGDVAPGSGGADPSLVSPLSEPISRTVSAW